MGVDESDSIRNFSQLPTARISDAPRSRVIAALGRRATAQRASVGTARAPGRNRRVHCCAGGASLPQTKGVFLTVAVGLAAVLAAAVGCGGEVGLAPRRKLNHNDESEVFEARGLT